MMTPEQILRAIEHYGLSLIGPTACGTRPGTEWIARSMNAERLGHGSTPREAVEAAVDSELRGFNKEVTA